MLYLLVTSRYGRHIMRLSPQPREPQEKQEREEKKEEEKAQEREEERQGTQEQGGLAAAPRFCWVGVPLP